MKTSKKAAIALSATMALSTVLVCLSGCGSATFNIADYATPLELRDDVYDGGGTIEDSLSFTQAAKLEGVTYASILDGNLISATLENGKEKLYSVKNKAYITDKEYDEVSLVEITQSTSQSGGIPYRALIELRRSHSDTEDAYSYVAPADGSILVEDLIVEKTALSSPISLVRHSDARVHEGVFPAGVSPITSIDELSYVKDGNEVKRYFTYRQEVPGGERTWRELQRSDFVLKDELPAGSAASGRLEAELLVEGNLPATLSPYTVTMESGNASDSYLYRVYRDDTATGSFSVHNGYALGAIGKYIYYFEEEEVDPRATKGFNVVDMSYSFTPEKKLVTYYRYDVEKDSSSKISCDYYISSMESLYNYTAGDYTAAIVSGYKFVDGVATINGSGKEYELILNDKLKVEADISALPYSPTDCIDLGNGNYMAGSPNGTYFLDKDLNVRARLESPASFMQIYPDQQLVIGEYGAEMNRVAVDFTGKVVLEPKYQNLYFYNGVALTEVKDSDKTQSLLVDVEHPDGRTPAEVLGLSEEDATTAVAHRDGVIYRLSPTVCALYTYAGTKLCDLPTEAYDPTGSSVSIQSEQDYAIFALYNYGVYIIS